MLATVAMLIALEIVLTRFLSIQTPLIRIGFGFLPIAVIGMKYGPLQAGIAAAMADVIGFFLFSTFTYHPGFTITAFLTGVTYGLLLHKGRHQNILNIIFAVLIVTIAWNMFLDTFWLTQITGQGAIGFLAIRVLRTVIMLPLQIIFISAAANFGRKAKLV